jgi:hypothetical protein
MWPDAWSDKFLNDVDCRFSLVVAPAALPTTSLPSDSNQSQIQGQTREVLEAFGNIRYFQRELRLASQDQVRLSFHSRSPYEVGFFLSWAALATSSLQVFRVEFYNLRDAEEAYKALNDHQAFEMRFTSFGWGNRKGEGAEGIHAGQLECPSTPTTNCIPFPPSGGQSNTTEGAQVGDKAPTQSLASTVKVRQRCASDGHSDTSPTPSSALAKPFDESTSLQSSPKSSAHGTPQQDVYGRRSSNCLFFDATRSSPSRSQPRALSRRPRSLSFDQTSPVGGSEENAGKGHEIGDDQPSPSFQHRQYTYNPQDGSNAAHDAQTFYATPHYPASSAPYFPTYSFPEQAPFPVRQPFTPANSTVPGPTYDLFAPYVPANHHNPFVPRHTHTGLHNAMYRPMMTPPGTMFYLPQAPRLQEMQPTYVPPSRHPIIPTDDSLLVPTMFAAPHSLHINGVPHRLVPPRPPFVIPDQSASVPAQTRARRTPHSLRDRSPPPERNQLYIQRIEDGLDTRTTVMIKNIPNKMSDKDLERFIANVRPRRIDFMYLRMDFNNGELPVTLLSECANTVPFRLQRWLCLREFHHCDGSFKLCESEIRHQVVSGPPVADRRH